MENQTKGLKFSATRLTRDQAAIISAFTGIAVGPFRDIHEYAERLLGRPILTHEFANSDLCEELKQAALNDFVAIAAVEEGET